MQTSERPGPHRETGWKDIIISLLVANHVWEAHTLFKIYIHYEQPQSDAELRQILDAIPSEPDTMYRLVEMSMLIECLRCVELPNDKDSYWRKRLEVALSDGSTMNNTAFPITDSSAYQALQLFAAKKLKYQNAKLPDQLLDSAMESGNFMFALAISAQYSTPLPGGWIAQTGADIRAITSWHHDLWIPRPSPPTGRVLLNVISYPAARESQQVNKTQHCTSRALQISVISTATEQPQTWFVAFKRAMQRVTLTATDIMLNNISVVTSAYIRLVGFYGECIKHAINAANCTADNDDILAIMWNVIQRITQKAILTIVTVIPKLSLGAMIGSLGPVDSIWKAIMKDPANVELFKSFEDDWWTTAHFFVDLLEPMKRFSSAGSTDGDPFDHSLNAYNELDLSHPMNRHAILCQIQRFFNAIIEVFRQKNLDVGRFEMDTRLETDSTELLITKTALKCKDDKANPESWLFINGIAGEFYWNNLAVSKIQNHFFDCDDPEDNSGDAQVRRTMINSVFKRSDGILWDLIGCAAERRSGIRGTSNTSRKAPLSSRTASSREAQATLSETMRSALIDSQHSRKDIIMIAHSQGCLLLRLTLEEIYADIVKDFRRVMRTHLHVYTFGNPAYDWDVHAYTASTEHFANELDFVAKLGVLRQFNSTAGVHDDLTYCSRCRAGDEKHLSMPKQLIFVNNKRQSGHLFGSQYSLRASDYDCVNAMSSSGLLSRSKPMF